jgi:dihydroorotase
VVPRALKSQGHNTPFLGYELPAVVRATLVAGRIGFERH